ncbi:sulfotransferase [Candidatus Poribacteria bacterium]|nr:sulfotransferase [Candidatus Poribacteria bacterium]
MTIPNFFIIGAPKCGTTSLYMYLRNHPQVHMSPVKEPNFFSIGLDGTESRGAVPRTLVRTWEEYHALFAEAGARQAIGEASPSYFSNPRTPQRLLEAAPGARLVVMLRDPAERAFSNYLHWRRLGFEKDTHFLRAAGLEAWRAGHRSPRSEQYLGIGFYTQCLQPFLDRFPRERVGIFFHDDLRRDPAALTREVARFLGVDDTWKPNVELLFNVSEEPRAPALEALHRHSGGLRDMLRPVLPLGIRRAIRSAIYRRPRLAPADRDVLIEFYREEIRRVEELTGRDLSAWLGGRRG